jgi:hypothetical protein
MLRILAILLLTFTATAQTTVKFQVFGTLGHTLPMEGNVTTNSYNAGVALKIQFGKHLFVRPYISGGKIIPKTAAKSFPAIQTGAMLGVWITKHFALAGGAGTNILLPTNKPNAYLPTATFSTVWKLSKHLGLFTPTSFNSRGTTLAIQYGWTF